MRTVALALALGTLVAVGFVEWRAAIPEPRNAPVATSQIYIHGTPVCVLKHGDAIVARVGRCDALEALPDAPSPEGPSLNGPDGAEALPPGHPPIPDGVIPEGNRPVPI